MMNEIELRANAMLAELVQQRAVFADRAAQLAGDNAVLRAKIAELEKSLAGCAEKAA